MKNGGFAMKHLSLPRKILLVLAILLVLYLIPCFYVSAELNRIVHDSYRTFGKQNNHTQVISDQWFARLNCHEPDHSSVAAKETFRTTFPLTVLWPGGGKSVYWYSYESLDAKGSLMTGTWDSGVLISYSFQDGSLHITDVFNPIVSLFKSIFVEHIYSN